MLKPSDMVDAEVTVQYATKQLTIFALSAPAMGEYWRFSLLTPLA